MPIEIKELHIKINVEDPHEQPASGKNSPLEKEQLIAECVEQVMDILARKEER